MERSITLRNEEHYIRNIARDKQMDEVLLRVLADAMPTERARTVAPTLEDYYLHVFGDASGT